MKCSFCQKICNMTVRDSSGNLYNCCVKCYKESRDVEDSKKTLNISVVYKKGD